MYIFSKNLSFFFFSLDVLFTHSGLSCGRNSPVWVEKVHSGPNRVTSRRSLTVSHFVADVIVVIISAIKTYSSPLTFTPLKERGTDTVYIH